MSEEKTSAEHTDGAQSNALHDIELFLQVAQERLNCLIEYGYIQPCDALDTLKEHLDLSLGLAQTAVGKTKPFSEVRKELGD